VLYKIEQFIAKAEVSFNFTSSTVYNNRTKSERSIYGELIVSIAKFRGRPLEFLSLSIFFRLFSVKSFHEIGTKTKVSAKLTKLKNQAFPKMNDKFAGAERFVKHGYLESFLTNSLTSSENSLVDLQENRSDLMLILNLHELHGSFYGLNEIYKSKLQAFFIFDATLSHQQVIILKFLVFSFFSLSF
jgi:hypothetical protein